MRLKEITNKIGSGATPKGGESVYLPTRGRFALIRSQNVFDRHFRSDGLAFISDQHADELQGASVNPGDILINITGDGVTFARACQVPEDILPACVNQHVSIVRPDPARCLPGYLVSYLTHPAIKHYIESFNAGGSRRAITKGHIESFEVPLPPIPQQHCIAGILCSLDDKIDLNCRMNETLEAMARAIFKSWFVDFDPVRAKMERRQPVGMDAETASLFPETLQRAKAEPVPRGWHTVEFGTIADVTSGKRPGLVSEIRTPEANVPVFGGAGPMGFTTTPLFEEPILVTGRVGTLGRIHRVANKAWLSDNTLVIIPKDTASYEYAFLFLKSLDLASLNRGSTQPLLTQSDLTNQLILLPNIEVLTRFHRLCSPLFAKCDQSIAESEALSRLRDALLPKLLSGEIRVKDAEKTVGARL